MAVTRARWAVLLFFLGAALFATWPLAAHLGEALPSDLGDPLLVAWIIGWDAERARHLFQGLWDAPIFFPYLRTLAFSEHLLGIAVPVAPLVWLTGNPIVAHNVAFIGSFVLAAFGMYWLVTELTGRRDAGLLAGLIFAFAPARIAQISHVQILMSGWMPLALLMLHRFLRSQSRAALAGFVVFFVVQAYSNGYYLYFLGLASAIVVGAALAGRSVSVRHLVRLSIAALVIVLALLPMALVYVDVRQIYGLHRTIDDVRLFGADLGSYLHGPEVAGPRLELWRWLPFVAKPPGPEGELFPGVIAFALACLGLWPARGENAPTRTLKATYATVAIVALVLSLGIQPTAWGKPLPSGPLYLWLFEHVPGFDGLRVAARFSALVLLAVAAAAGLGFARIAARLTPRWRAVACGVLACLIGLEGVPRAFPLADVKPRGRPDRAAYTWVRDHEAGAVLELPTGALDPNVRDPQYGYQTLFHGHRLLNGFGGYESPLHLFIGGPGSPLLDFERFGEALRMLRSIGVRTIVVHPEWFGAPAFADAILQALRADRAQVTSEATFPGITVFRLAAPEGAAPARPSESAVPSRQPLAPSEFVATASHASDRLDQAFDGNPDTRWLTGGNQNGDEWIEIAFARPVNLARLTIWTTLRSFTDYPRELLVEASDGSEAFSPLFKGSVVTLLAEGLAREPRRDPIRGPIDLEVSANEVRRLRLRQVGTTRTWFWSIDELQLFERR